MEERWLEVSVTVDPEVAEAVSEVFNRFNPGADGRGGAIVEISGFDPVGDADHLQATVRTYLPDTPEGRTRLQRIEAALGHLNMIRPVPEPQVRVLNEADWANAWKAHYHPVRIGERCLIVPAWQEYTPASADEIVIRLEPGMAFGTGLHPTTRLALRLLEHARPEGKRVLDVGTGSGILSIAAALYGAAHVLGTDIDPHAVKAATENARRNRVEERVEIRSGSLPADEPSFDLVVVNILPHIILQLFQEGLWAHVRPGGELVLSGIVEPREVEILLAVAARGGEVVERLQEEDWIGLRIVKPEG